MKAKTLCLAGTLLAWIASPAGAAEKSKQAAYQSNKAVIVVTGMRLNEDPADYRKDLSVAEGAVVRVTARGGATRENRTEAFIRAGQRGGPGRKYLPAPHTLR